MSNNIDIKGSYFSGNIDLNKSEIWANDYSKYNSCELGIREIDENQKHGSYITFSEIQKVIPYNSAVKLIKEIEKRYNEYPKLIAEVKRLKEWVEELN